MKQIDRTQRTAAKILTPAAGQPVGARFIAPAP